MAGWKNLVQAAPMFLLGTLVVGCWCTTSLCDIDLTFDLAIVTMTFYIIVSNISRKVCEVLEVNIW